MSTPTIRSYEYHHSRAGAVVTHVMGERFQRVLGSDFSAGSNIHEGLHQRCRAHFLREVQERKKKGPQGEALLTWAKAVKAIDDEGVAWTRLAPDP